MRIPLFGIREDRALTLACVAVCAATTHAQLEVTKNSLDHFVFPQWYLLLKHLKAERMGVRAITTNSIVAHLFNVDGYSIHHRMKEVPRGLVTSIEKDFAKTKEILRNVSGYRTGTYQYECALFLMILITLRDTRFGAWHELTERKEFRRRLAAAGNVDENTRLTIAAGFVCECMSFWDEHTVDPNQVGGNGDADLFPQPPAAIKA